MNAINAWFRRYFSDPQVIYLASLLTLGFAIVLFFGSMLAPVLAAVVIAYLLEGLVAVLQRRGVPRLLAVAVVFMVFSVFVTVVLLVLLPLLSGQVTHLVGQLPKMIAAGQAALLELPQRYPGFVSEAQITEVIDVLRQEVASLGQLVLARSVSSIVGLITVMVYLVLVPLLVFFFLKDKEQIHSWFRRYLPEDRRLVTLVWRDVDVQIGNYVRGKFWEILIVGSATFVTFSVMGLQYAMLLAVLVGLSVIIPYVGAVVVTFPVMLIAYYQWGWGPDFAYIMLAYFIIQALDGNVLVPLLFSEAVNLHPIAIIVAILFFGGLWGLLGVFFAIPLATLVQAVLVAWPNPQEEPVSSE